jgi:glucose-6-phosphate isomerase
MLSAYLQQAEMESNGKSVNWLGEKIDDPTVPLI